ncbi:MAG: hypothetical protein WCA91_18425 [Candidatus Acidiferrales bacterium]
MPTVDWTQPSTERRRSERILESVPLIVRGTDLLGQPFEERTTTLMVNLHGCRYASKHHLPRNTSVTLELPQSTVESQLGMDSASESRPGFRARVAWVQRPHSIREFFQVAVELETPANIWGLQGRPADWSNPQDVRQSQPATAETASEASQHSVTPVNLETFRDKVMTEARTDFSASPSFHESGPGGDGNPTGSGSAPDNPLLRELRAELDRQTKEAVAAAADQAREEVLKIAEETQRRQGASAEELFAKWKSEIEQIQSGAREEFSSHVSSRRDEAVRTLQAEFDQKVAQAHELIDRVERQAEGLRAERAVVQEATKQVADAVRELEAVEASRAAKPAEPSQEEALAVWRQRLESEMALAKNQWNELLQSSLDSNLRRVIEQLTERSQQAVHASQEKMTERLGEVRQPFAQAAAEARDTFAAIQSSLEQEVKKAQESLAAVEQVASRAKELSTQLEAASHDTVNELHRRLERILDSQTAEINRRAETIAAGLSQRVAPMLDSLAQQSLDRMAAQAEAKLALHLERVPALLSELSAGEMKAEESLHSHREQLRQVTENNQREAAAQIADTMARAQVDFDAARKDALTKWVEELDSNRARAWHAAAEAIGRTSESLQQEARLHFQALAEQAVMEAGARLAENSAVAEERFESQIAALSDVHVAQIRVRVENGAGEVIGRARTELDRAAEAAAASFGQVVHEVSEREITQFGAAASSARRERLEEFARTTQQLHQQLEANAFSSAERFRSQMASQLENNVSEGRAALSAEFASSFEAYRRERDAYQQEWAANLDKMSGDSAGKFQEKLQNTADSWVVSSVRRLNEHGQNGIESLLRTADQALRDSCSKVFESLAEMLRERVSSAAGVGNVAGFAANSNREPSESSGPRNEAI